MAQQSCPHFPPPERSHLTLFFAAKSQAAKCLSVLVLAFTGAVPAAGQTPQQQYVYASTSLTASTSQVGGFSKDAAGALSPLSGAPFSDPAFQGGPMAIDGKGQFLFVLDHDNSNIWMFQINQDTGALTKTPQSPFAVQATETAMAPASPVCLANERSGQFLYVGYTFGSFPGYGAVIEYQIDAVNLRLVPVTGQQSSDIPAPPMGLLTDSKGLHLYVGLDPNSTSVSQVGGTNVYSIDPTSGVFSLAGYAGNVRFSERSIAIDPQGRFFFDGWGSAESEGFIEGAPILADGTAPPVAPPVSLGVGNVPNAMLVDGTGKFLYVNVPAAAGVYAFPIDRVTGAFSQPLGPMTGLTFQLGSAAADPQGPYIYSLQKDGIHAFQIIDPELGTLAEILGSPFSTGTTGGGIGGLAISGTPVQAVSGPAASFSPLAVSFGSITVGQHSSTRVVTLTSTGGAPLSLNSLTVSGANPSDFSATPNCSLPTVLPPTGTNSACTISVVFTPGAPGLRQAILTAADNATPNQQSIPLSGTGVAPQPAVTLTPGSLSFAATNQGNSSSPQNVLVTSSGLVTLHISSVQLSGSNTNDFQLTSGCNGTYPVNATCTISVTFAPLAAGLRTASIIITDDAPNSPQSIQVAGTGTGAPVTRPAVSFSPAVLSFGTITQGTLSEPKIVTVTSTGTAALNIASVVPGGANPGDFKMTNGCSPAAYPVNKTCTISVTFTPVAPGQRTASIIITDNAPNSPQTIALDGNVNIAFTLAPSSAGGISVTVTPGQTATYNLQLLPAPDFAGSVSLVCSGAPVGASCMVPGPLKVSGSPLPFSVTVTTTAATTAGASVMPFSVTPRLMPFTLWRALFPIIACVILLLVCSAQRVSGRAARATLPAFTAFALLAIFYIAGCGGGSATAQSVPITSPGATGTPQGAFTLVLTPAATSASGTQLAPLPPLQLTLVVN